MPDTAHAYDYLEGIYFPIAIGVFATVVLVLAVLLVRGRRRAQPDSTSEARPIEIGYAALLALVAGFLIWTTFRTEAPIDRLVARPGARITVLAAQWSWRFRYRGGVTVNDVSSWDPPVAVVPAGEEVEFDGTSADVIHGFWVPRLHFQRQILPGEVTRFDLLFRTPGRYHGQCSVYCGNRHTEMFFEIDAVSPAKYRRWLAHAAANPGSVA